MKKKEEYFFDPNKLPNGEKKYYEKMKPIIDALLSDLGGMGYIKKPTIVETSFLIEIMEDKDRIGLSFNRLQSIFSDMPTVEDFIKRNQDYFADEDLSYLFITQLYFLTLVHIEMFRNTLLFYLKRGRKRGKNWLFWDKMTLEPFFDSLKKISPVNGRLIEKELEPFVRNSFAHGLFSIEYRRGRDPFLLCYESIGKLEYPTKISLLDLMMKRKTINILYMTLTQVIAERIKNRSLR